AWEASVKCVVLVDFHGFRNSRWIATSWAGLASVIVMRPSPTLSFPVHAYSAPTPDGEPVNVRVIWGSSFSHGDHIGQRWKSSRFPYTTSLGAEIVVERSIWYVPGRVATTTASTSTTTRR